MVTLVTSVIFSVIFLEIATCLVICLAEVEVEVDLVLVLKEVPIYKCRLLLILKRLLLVLKNR